MYYTIVKYYDVDATYEDGCGDHLVRTSTFIQCDVSSNRHSTKEKAIEVLGIVTALNPCVGYGIVEINTDKFGFIKKLVPQENK